MQRNCGYAIGLGGLADTPKGSGIAFVPVHDSEHAAGFVIWKKYQVLSKAAEAYLKMLEQVSQSR